MLGASHGRPVATEIQIHLPEVRVEGDTDRVHCGIQALSEMQTLEAAESWTEMIYRVTVTHSRDGKMICWVSSHAQVRNIARQMNHLETMRRLNKNYSDKIQEIKVEDFEVPKTKKQIIEFLRDNTPTVILTGDGEPS